MSDLLAAESGIRRLQSLYTDSAWRKDFPAFGDCFTEDAEWRIGGGVFRGRDACISLLASVMPSIERVLISFGMPLVQLVEGAAIARTYVNELKFVKGEPPAFAIGIYYDRCVEADGEWRFAWHHYQSYYHGPTDLSGGFRHIIDYGAPFAMPEPDEPAPMAAISSEAARG